MRIIQNGYNQKRNAYDQTEFFICTHNYHPPLHRILGMGESSSSGYPGKYIFLRICSGDFGSVGYISYNVKDPVLLRGLSCAGKLHCPNVIHAKVFCSITLYVGMPQKSILYTIIIYQYIIRRFFYLLYLNFHRLILYLQKHRNNAKVLLFVFC